MSDTIRDKMARAYLKLLADMLQEEDDKAKGNETDWKEICQKIYNLREKYHTNDMSETAYVAKLGNIIKEMPLEN